MQTIERMSVGYYLLSVAVTHDLDEAVAYTTTFIIIFTVEAFLQVRNNFRQNTVTEFAHQISQCTTSHLNSDK